MANLLSYFHRLREWARAVFKDALALWIAARDPRTPLRAKIVAAVVAAYAFSPVDLIPDFIPVLGFLDDAVVLPLGILLAIRLIPAPLMKEFRARAGNLQDRPVSRSGVVGIFGIWIAAAGLGLWKAIG